MSKDLKKRFTPNFSSDPSGLRLSAWGAGWDAAFTALKDQQTLWDEGIKKAQKLTKACNELKAENAELKALLAEAVRLGGKEYRDDTWKRLWLSLVSRFNAGYKA